MKGESDPLPGQFIDGAQLFDIDEVADPNSQMKHMLPSSGDFAEAASKLGLYNEDHIVIYDRHGVRAAPRVWWMFQMFGHKRISILDGGLPAWLGAGYETVDKPAPPQSRSAYLCKPALSGVVSQSDILGQLQQSPQILDARSDGRFFGASPEPRAGLRSGHIPGSRCLPYTSILTSEKRLKPLSELAKLVETTNADLESPIITTCGSGVTAAALAFALHLLSAKDVSVYDGSWTEWGASDAPVSLTQE